VADQGQVNDLAPKRYRREWPRAATFLVDVREPNEVAAEAYPGAVVVPLSSSIRRIFPDPRASSGFLACRSGKRSVTASLAAQAGELAYDKNISRGACLAWKAAGRRPRPAADLPHDFMNRFLRIFP